MAANLTSAGKAGTFAAKLFRDIVKNKYIYIMAIPVFAYYVIFQYGPMYGAMIAFKNFSPGKGILGSPWVGFQNFQDFFGSVYSGDYSGIPS